MISYVLGAPGSGKTTLVPMLRSLLPGYAVLDWDAFMQPAGRIAGRAVRQSPRTWPGYGDLIRAVVESMLEVPVPVVLLGVCTPDELQGWPEGHWLLLDCDETERIRRLNNHTGAGRRPPDAGSAAVRDAVEYRKLGLLLADSTGLTPAEVAARLAALILNAN